MTGRYDEVCRNFTWRIPARYNAGEEASDAQAKEGRDVAIISVDPDLRETHFSFLFLSKFSNRLANLLIAAGLKPGDRVGVILRPGVEAAVAHISILKAGLVTMPISYGEAGAAVVSRLDCAGARAIITDQVITEMLGPLIFDSGIDLVQFIAAKLSGSGDVEYLESRLSGMSDRFTVLRDPDAPAFLSFTSGSEGPPKGVVHSHLLALGIRPGLLFTGMPTHRDRVWSQLDWGWLGGFLVPLAAWQCGSAVVVYETEGLSPGRTLDLLRATATTRVSINPTALRMMQMGVRKSAYPRLTSLTSGGERLDPELRQWSTASFGIEVSELYGQSECSGVLGSGHLLRPKEGTIGKPAPGQSVTIVNDDGIAVRTGEAGQIAVRSPHPAMFLGYWQDEEATAGKFLGSLLMTGDLGVKDEEGYIRYIGRADDVIKHAGYRIGPSEIEDILCTLPLVKHCVAVGVPSKISGEEIVVWVEAADEEEVNNYETIIQRFAEENLPKFKRPSKIRFVEEIPKTKNGKLSRAEVRKSEIMINS